MLDIEVVGLPEMIRGFERLGRDLPKAIAKGLNRTGQTLIERERLEMQRAVIANPVPFTLNAHRQWFAKPLPGKMDTVVFIMDKQAEYLKTPILGKDYTGVAPGPAARINQYGNIIGKRGGLQSMKGKVRGAGEFVGKVKGTAKRGPYAGRTFDLYGRFVRLPKRNGLRGGLIVVAKKVTDQDRDVSLRWYEVGERWVTSKLPEHMRKELEAALLQASRGRRG